MGRKGSSQIDLSDLEKQIAKLTKQLAKVKPETKFLDSTLTTTNISVANGNAIHLTAIASGTAVYNRIGDNVIVNWIEVHFYVPYSGSVALDSVDLPSYRIYLVQDTQQVASTPPTGVDLVDQPSIPIIQLLQVTEQKRFKVLHDFGPQLLIWGTASSFATSVMVQDTKFHQHFKQKCNIPVQFSGTGSSSIQKNGLYLMVYSNVQTSGTDILDLVGSARIGFTDA